MIRFQSFHFFAFFNQHPGAFAGRSSSIIWAIRSQSESCWIGVTVRVTLCFCS